MKNASFDEVSSVQRRTVLKAALRWGTGGLGLWHSGAGAGAGAAEDDFTSLLSTLQTNPELAAQIRSGAEREYGVRAGLERAPIKASKSLTPISKGASDLIIACEVTSKTVYNKRYQSPIWPKGESGVTIGIGYDIGYVSPLRLKSDWMPYIGADHIATLTPACGHKGTAAATFIKDMRVVKIGWEDARRQFFEQVSPRYVGETEAALPNTAKLNDDMLGALVSLTYNRGASYGLKKPRYAQMRAIKSHMQSGQFEKIPDEIRAMKWIWKSNPDLRGLLLRRDAEAALFELGLRSR